MLKKIVPFLALTALLTPCFSYAISSSSSSETSGLKGRILLQVQSRGEAWYVNPSDGNRYFLGSPETAIGVLSRVGLGVTNNQLLKIPVGFNSSGDLFGVQPTGEVDQDEDGIPNEYEVALGTDPSLADSDNDGYTDLDEIRSGYDPLRPSTRSPASDKALINRLKGKVLLQVESRGQAWYVNPADGRRYYLGTPQRALAGMRYFGLGITNANLERIPLAPLITAVALQGALPTTNQSTPLIPASPSAPTPGLSIAPSEPAVDPFRGQPQSNPPRSITASLTVSAPQCGDHIQEGAELCDGEWYCDSQCGLSNISTIQSADPTRPCLPATETGGLFQMSIGSSCTYQVNNKIYTISLPDISPNYRYPRFVITDGSHSFDTGYTQTGFYSVENNFSIGRYRFTEITPSGIYSVILHKIIPTSQIVVRGNCDQLTGDPEAQDRCRAFIQYQQATVLPALDRISGGSMGRCYKDIQIVAAPDTSPYQGEADSIVESGMIVFKANQMRTVLNLTPMMEDHEMLHLMNFCLNIPNSEESRHSFFAAKMLELNRAAENNASADRLMTPVQFAANVNSSDPGGNGDLYGCAGIKTKFLSQTYLQDRSVFSRYFVELITHANKLVNNGEMGDKEEILYNQIVARVVHADQGMITQINNLCPRSHINTTE